MVDLLYNQHRNSIYGSLSWMDNAELIAQLLTARINLETSKRTSPSSETLSTVDEFLNLTRGRHCNADCDRIFGLLGVTKNPNITPDYTLMTRRIYSEKYSTSSGGEWFLDTSRVLWLVEASTAILCASVRQILSHLRHHDRPEPPGSTPFSCWFGTQVERQRTPASLHLDRRRSSGHTIGRIGV